MCTYQIGFWVGDLESFQVFSLLFQGSFSSFIVKMLIVFLCNQMHK